jgi:ethanolamine utilization protein EutP
MYVKTHTVQLVGDAIDTPGEYIENRILRHRLKVTASDARLVLFLQDASALSFHFAPGQASMFGGPVAGVVTKIDLAGEKEVGQARELLNLAGASPHFAVSLLTGEGLEGLKAFIAENLGFGTRLSTTGPRAPG